MNGMEKMTKKEMEMVTGGKYCLISLPSDIWIIAYNRCN